MLLIRHVWLITFIPLVVGAINYRKLDKGLKAFFLFVIFAVLTELTSKIVIYYLEIKNTMPIGHIYIAGAFLFTGIFFLHQLEGFVRKIIIIGIIVFFEFLSIFNMLFIQNIHSFPSISGAIGAITLVAFTILLFSKIMAEGKIQKLTAEPVVWINSAILIYYACNFFFYILYNVILGVSREFSLRTVGIFSAINGLFYLLLAIGFLKAGGRTR